MTEVDFFFIFLNLMLESMASPKRCNISSPLIGQSGTQARLLGRSSSELEIEIGRGRNLLLNHGSHFTLIYVQNELTDSLVTLFLLTIKRIWGSMAGRA